VTRNTEYEVLIVGGGPAGSAAAIVATQRGLRVRILERYAAPRPGQCAGWLGPGALARLQAWGVDAAALGRPFSGLRLRSWDLKQCVEVHDPKLKGCVVPANGISSALLQRAAAGGAHVKCGVHVEQVQLGESAVSLRLSDGSTASGQVLLIADGAASPTAELAHLGAARRVGGGLTCAAAVVSTDQPGTGLDVVLSAGPETKVATFAHGPDHLRVVVVSRDEAQPAGVQLQALLSAARSAGLLSATQPVAVSQTVCLAGSALEMESHVGKRCLLIGDAGGFVSAFSHDGLYPALRSGELAAETVAAALRARVLQDELATFSTVWRSELAEYLRMPNTDLGLLMPMVFSNPQMSRRIARAFLLGQAL